MSTFRGALRMAMVISYRTEKGCGVYLMTNGEYEALQTKVVEKQIEAIAKTEKWAIGITNLVFGPIDRIQDVVNVDASDDELPEDIDAAIGEAVANIVGTMGENPTENTW